MDEFFRKFFDTADFPPRWYCGNWSDFHGWLHIGSDVAIWAAYFAIPAVLVYFARKRRDVPFHGLFLLFAAFILACGTTHLIDAYIFWQPIYRISAAAKFVTAVVSWATVVALLWTTPRVIHFPSLAATNERLEQEIARRSEIEENLQAANARHEALLAGTRSIVWTTSPDGGFTAPQPSWQRYTGQTWEEHQDYGWLEAVQESDRPDLLRRWNEALSTGAKHQTTGRIWHQETQRYRRFVVEAVPVRNDEGTIREWVGTVTDIEEEHQAVSELGIARTELAKQNLELELIYEAAPVGMSLMDRDYRYLRINETLARFNGIPREQHIGRRGDELLKELDGQLKPVYERVFATGQPVLDIEIVGRTPASEEVKTWLASYFPLVLPQDDADAPKPIGAVSAIVQDITHRKEQEKRLRESERLAQAANRSKSEFLANMSHEIRTPMSAILGYADVLLGHLKDPDNRNCALIMKRNGEYLLELINDILDLSRIEAGKVDVKLESCALAPLVAEVQSLMQVRADEKRICFRVAFEGMAPRAFRTDATRLRQVLINLIGNAIKFTEEGEVTLKVRYLGRAEPPCMEFAVQDTGIGISDEQRQQLFQPFSQGDASVTRRFGGSGLGLAISRRLVEMMHGDMEVASELGKGSTFFVRLPVDSVEESELVTANLLLREAEPEPVVAETPRLSCRVLVIDDRRDVRHISQHFLEIAGATVATAEDGQLGADAVIAAQGAGSPFDLIVMDVQMPNVDGLQATAKLRAAGVETPIIALTADAMKGDRDRCLRAGCDDYLSKPIDHAKLVRLVWRYAHELTLDELRTIRKRETQID